MKENSALNSIWLKSAVLGCLWASSEIVLGGFLHNLKIPFRGDILTFIGIILLISAGQNWRDKGLFWRSGLICALMKAMSPSAVIFGPMIAIFSEALLLEFVVRIFKRNLFSFILGGILAMSWTFFHKLFSFILMYGFNMIDLYTQLLKFAQNQFNFHFQNIWMPFIILWSFYVLIGIVAALTGFYIGRKALNKTGKLPGLNMQQITKLYSRNIDIEFKYSFIWLGVIFFGTITVLFLMNNFPWMYWLGAGIVLIVLLIARYRHALRQLKKIKFWISFVVITLLASIAFAKVQNMENGFSHGLVIGLQMNFRALVMVIGFSALGRELCNPKIRLFFVKTIFRQLPPALEVAFDTLPFVVASLPKARDIFRSPFAIIQQLVTQADFWLERIRLKQKCRENVVILTGGVGQGKTSALNEIIAFLELKNIKIGGVISPAVFENKIPAGYDLINLKTKKQAVISRTTGTDEMVCVGKYFFHKDGFAFGQNALSLNENTNSQVIVIDEIGLLELKNQGWASSLNVILNNLEIPVILVVRSALVEQVIANWYLVNPLIIDISSTNSQELISRIVNSKKLDGV
jgi:nucleoside-triphosphatase